MDMDEENEDIAAAMGFSSFGGAKKRKFEQANSPKTNHSASGANSTQLGVRSKDAVHDAFQDRVDAVPLNSSTPKSAKPAASTGLAEFLARAKALPEKPLHAAEGPPSIANQEDSSATENVSFGGQPISRAEVNALRFGIKNENGDTAYFLPSFVEDPWANLKRG
jgi:hypothetical protein